MEKLKDLINPGSKKDDEVMYGSGRSDDLVHTGDTNIGNTNDGFGQGSHTTGHDPLSTSSNPTGTSQYDRDATTRTSQYDGGITGRASHGLSEPYASRMPGGFDNDDDAATTASVSSGIPGQSQSRSAMTGANEPTFTNKPLPREPASAGIGLGKSSLTGNIYPDRSIANSSKYGDQSASSHLGRDAFGDETVGAGIHRHEDPQRDNYAPESGRTFPLAGSSTSGGYSSGTGAIPSSGNQDSLDRDSTPGAGIGTGTTTGTGYGPESWQHEHQHHGHQYEGDPCETGAAGDQGGPHFVSGPHVTDTANRLDPHVGSGIGDAATTGASSGRLHHGRDGHRGEEAALGGGAGATGVGVLEADRGTRGTTNTTSSVLDPSNDDRHGLDTNGGGAYDNEHGTAAGVSSTGKTTGPHKSSILNKLDPRVDSDLSKQQGSHGGDHHHGRDATLTGADGTVLYEAEKHHRSNEPNLATSSTTSGMGGQSPYGSNIDTRVDSTPSGIARDKSAVSSAGSCHQPAATSDHHYRRDPGVVGAGGIGAFEAEKHLGSSNRSHLAATPQDQLAGSGHQPATATGSSLYPSSSYGDESQAQTGHHPGRDPLAAAGVWAGATGGVDNAQKIKDYGRTDPGTQVREHRHAGASVAAYPSPGHGKDTAKEPHTGHHSGRDAALGGGAGAGAGALAGRENSQRDSHRDAAGYGNKPYQDASQSHHTGRDAAVVGRSGAGAGHDNEPYQDISHGHHAGRDSAAVGGIGAGTGALAGQEYSQRNAAGYGTEPYQDTSRGHHTGRDAAILGGAAGAGGLAEHEYSKKDAEKLQKEHAKEEKEHSKDVKHHNKELAKEEKVHEKAIDKSGKKHEKAIEKDEKKHEKAIAKDEKKHGGLLGFLHRDKPDKELKEEGARRQAATHPGRGEEEMAAGSGATGLGSSVGYDPLQGEHGSQSGVHDTPIGIGSGPTTHDAYGSHDSGHNKLHKDPPAKVAESRGYEFQ